MIVYISLFEHARSHIHMHGEGLAASVKKSIFFSSILDASAQWIVCISLSLFYLSSFYVFLMIALMITITIVALEFSLAD